MQFKDYLKTLEASITAAYESSPTLDEAEKLAAKYLEAQIKIGSELAKVDLDARMKKSGVKAIRAAVYLETATKGDKKPSDVLIEAVINSDATVASAQDGLDNAEVSRNELENWLSVCRDAHIYFRGTARGRFE